MNVAFHSHWKRELQAFIEFRQTYFTSPWPSRKLLLFDRYATHHPRLSLVHAITGWLQREPRVKPTTRNSDLIAIRQFCLYRRRFAPDSFVPDWVGPGPSAKSGFHPCLLSTDQIKSLLAQIPKLPGPPLRHARLRTLLLVLYCTGLRTSEALRLRLVDVDLRHSFFRIGPSKGRVRLVPFRQDLTRELKHWLQQRRHAGFVLTPQTSLFEREDGRPESRWNTWAQFSNLFHRCGLKPSRGHGRGGLRVHDLRHNFAVHRLQRWYRAGRDPGPLLPWLSAYLGHVNLIGTERYLHATPLMLATAARRFHRSLGFNPAIP
jgi:integrase/recombinase XerD